MHQFFFPIMFSVFDMWSDIHCSVFKINSFKTYSMTFLVFVQWSLAGQGLRVTRQKAKWWGTHDLRSGAGPCGKHLHCIVSSVLISSFNKSLIVFSLNPHSTTFIAVFKTWLNPKCFLTNSIIYSTLSTCDTLCEIINHSITAQMILLRLALHLNSVFFVRLDVLTSRNSSDYTPCSVTTW